MAPNLSKRNIAANLRGIARDAADPSYAAGLRYAADQLDDGAGSVLHTCKTPDKGTSFQCRCGVKWFFLYQQTGATLVGRWEPDTRRKVGAR